MNAGYAPLWVKSAYSFLEGASQPHEIVEQAADWGLPAVALTDRDGVYGMVRAHVRAQELGVRLIVGSQVTVADGSHVVLLAMDRNGYGNLCRLITQGRLRSVKGESRVYWSEVCERAQGLVALWGGRGSAVVEEREPLDTARLLKDAFGDRLYVLLERRREPDDGLWQARTDARAKAWNVPLVAGAEVLYHAPCRRPLQDVLTCVRWGTTLSEAGRRLIPNGERYLRDVEGFNALYADAPDTVARTREIAMRCEFSLSDLRYRYPAERVPGGASIHHWLRTLAHRGLGKRYPGGAPRGALRQLSRELALVEELDYGGYFLTMWEIVQFCQSKNILCQGRGSAANSILCYCLEVTAVDPIRMGLLFERFISRERAEPPDIDLDIEHDRREEVIQHVYERYGREHAAMVANFIRYRSRSAIRDVGKVLGLDETAIERFARHLSGRDGSDEEHLREAGWDAEQPLHQALLRLTQEIHGIPRHLSIHPGGFLLGSDPVCELTPIENATMPGRTVIQWDKEDVEDLGLFKVDLLGLGALNVTHRALDLIERHHKQKWDLASVPPDDEPTFEMMRQGDTVGVFQIESRAQMAMLPRLRPKNYYDLVIEISIVRPGPITGGMVHPYLRRRNGVEPVTYPHESLRPVLEKTLGVPLFQEQVMKLAMVAAEYTPGEADQLRRDMAAWRQEGRMERHRTRLLERMTQKGIDPEFAERVFEQIRGFGEYGFPESHAASFALIAYATAWLKRHYPAAFLAAMLNAQPMGFYSPATLIEDGKRHGVVVEPVCAQRSGWECQLEPDSCSASGFSVRMGLQYVRGLQEVEARRLLRERDRLAFASSDDLARRVAWNAGTLERLAASGALALWEPRRRQTLWNVYGSERDRDVAEVLTPKEGPPSFEELSVLEETHWDYSASGHSARGHPLAPLREDLRSRGWPDAASVIRAPNGSRIDYAGLVICRQRPGTAGGVVFMTLEDETGFVNLVIWEKVFRRYQIIAKTESFLGVSGRVQSESGVTHLIAQRLWTPDLSRAPHKARSRDFH